MQEPMKKWGHVLSSQSALGEHVNTVCVHDLCLHVALLWVCHADTDNVYTARGKTKVENDPLPVKPSS